MTTFTYTLTGSVEAPDGSELTETGTGIRLPDGRVLKIWETLEPHTSDEQTYRDLSFGEAADMGIHYDGDMCRFEAPDVD